MGTQTEPTHLDDVVLRGSTLALRAASRADVPALVQFFAGLSQESRYFRFLGSPKLDVAAVERLLPPDRARGYALVGECRWSRERSGGAVDGSLVCGAGGVLVDLLADSAFRLHPVTAEDATEMIAELRVARPQELDLNPVTVLPQGVCAVDVRVRVERAAAKPISRRVQY